MRRLIHAAGVILFAGTMFAPDGVRAEPTSVIEAEGDDIRLIIDISGSMKKNDPENLRVPAVNLLVKLLPPGASAGVWTFGHRVSELVRYGKTDAAWRESALKKTSLINSVGLYTNIGAALEEVLLRDETAGTAILLTDGVVDISKDPIVNEVETNRIIKELLPELVSRHALVHTVALSENADKNLLKELASSTGGLFEIAYTAEDLTRIFLRMFDDAVNQDRLPMRNGQFTVDSSIEEFTLLAFKSDPTPIQLRSPENEYYLISHHPDFVTWYSDNGFELITVKRPVEGQWQLFADQDPQNRVTVLSDLKLHVSDIDNTVYEGDIPSIAVSFLNEGALIIEDDFLKLMDVQLIVQPPSGNRRAKQLSRYVEGIFSSKLDVFAERGRYQIKVSVDGRTFQREMVQELEYKPLINVDYLSEHKLLKVVPANRGLINDQISMIVSVIDESDKRRLLPMQLMNDSYWQTSLENLEPGQYHVQVHVEGLSDSGNQLNFRIDRMPVTVVRSAKPDPNQADIEPESETEYSWLDEYLIYIITALGNIVIAGLAIWFFRRRRSSDEHEDPEIADLIDRKEPVESKEEPDYGEGLSDIVDAWSDDQRPTLGAELESTQSEVESRGSIFDDPLDGEEESVEDTFDSGSEDNGADELRDKESEEADEGPDEGRNEVVNDVDEIDSILTESSELADDDDENANTIVLDESSKILDENAETDDLDDLPDQNENSIAESMRTEDIEDLPDANSDKDIDDMFDQNTDSIVDGISDEDENAATLVLNSIDIEAKGAVDGAVDGDVDGEDIGSSADGSEDAAIDQDDLDELAKTVVFESQPRRDESGAS